MSIRTKLFIALLAFAIIPLIVAGLLARVNVGETRVRLVDSSFERIAAIADDTRTHIVQKHAAILERDRALVEIDVRVAAEALRSAWRAGPSIESDNARVFVPADFEDPASGVPGLEADEEMQRIGPDGIRSRVLRSEAEPVFVVQPGMPRDRLAREAAMLRTLVPVLRASRDDTASLIRPSSQFVALEGSGLHMSWPGKGGYPDGYDPREREWYRAALRAEGAVVWTRPIIDAPTGQVRFSCAIAVQDDSGKPIGVTAADVRLRDVLRELDLPDAFRDQSQAMIVATIDGVPGPPIVIAAASYSELAGAEWDAPIELVRFESDDPAAAAGLGDRMRNEARGTIELGIGGRPWVWTWERLSDGQTAVLVGISLDAADRAASDIAESIGDSVAQTARGVAVIAGGVVMLAVVAGFLGARTITGPVTKLADAAASVAEGDLDARAEVRGAAEFRVLAQSFNSMVPKLRDRIRVRESLALAQEVQQNLLPSGPPCIPGFDIAARSVYCDETGGDYYDFFDLTDIAPGRHAIVVGDVTGHGVAAALLMTTARALLHARSDESDRLAETIGRVNRHLSRDARSGQFMTLFYLLIDTRTRRARWVSAGHDAAIVLEGDGTSFAEFAGQDIPLGIEGDWTFQEAEAALPRGGVAVIGTDGIWECRSPSGEMFGKDRLRAIIRGHAGAPAERIADEILRAVADFRAGGEQTDDITLVVIRADDASPSPA